MDGLSPYLTVSEAADELGVSIPSVWESVDSGELPSVPTRLIPRPAFEVYRRKLARRAAADRDGATLASLDGTDAVALLRYEDGEQVGPPIDLRPSQIAQGITINVHGADADPSALTKAVEWALR